MDYDNIVNMIYNQDYLGAVSVLSKSLSGIDWDGSEHDNPAMARDGYILQAINNLHSARLCPSENDKKYFARCAVLTIRILSGDSCAADEYRRIVASGAMLAEAELTANFDETLDQD